MPDLTPFAPGTRSPLHVAEAQQQIVRAHPAAHILEALQVPLLVLNADRQIVFANGAALAVVGAEQEQDVCGLRPGEALECVNSRESGCGESPACRACGQLRALLDAQAGRVASELCHLTRRDDRGAEMAADLRIRTNPVEFGGEWFSLVTFQEITDSIRREVLERTLFEDVGRLALQIEQTSAWIRPETSHELRERAGGMVVSLARRLRALVLRQEILAAAEKGSLRPVYGESDSAALLRAAAAAVTEGSAGAPVAVDPGAENVVLRTDSHLAGIVLGELLENALEASGDASMVSATCKVTDGRLEFRVSNPAVVAPAARLRMFRRSASTKGPGRGVGTYLAKTVAERYLGATLRFQTGEQGTAFTVSFPLGSELR